MKKVYKSIILRYLLLLVILFIGVGFSYFLFAKPTLYSSYFLFRAFFSEVFVSGTDIFIGEKVISIVGSCVAGSAYLLLVILNLSVPDIKIRKRISILISSFLIFFILNVLRIFYLGVLYLNESVNFDVAHKTLWYFGSTLIIVLIWFLEVGIFKIKGIPFYSDLKKMHGLIQKSQKH
jgi:exosortase/archaeosortase family protein